MSERALWSDGPPHESFKTLRSECPVHWTEGITEYPEEAGYWSVTRADELREVSMDWRTYSSERGGIGKWRPSADCNAPMPPTEPCPLANSRQPSPRR